MAEYKIDGRTPEGVDSLVASGVALTMSELRDPANGIGNQDRTESIAYLRQNFVAKNSQLESYLASLGITFDN